LRLEPEVAPGVGDLGVEEAVAAPLRVPAGPPDDRVVFKP
jgi:hypothetical protein